MDARTPFGIKILPPFGLERRRYPVGLRRHALSAVSRMHQEELGLGLSLKYERDGTNEALSLAAAAELPVDVLDRLLGELAERYEGARTDKHHCEKPCTLVFRVSVRARRPAYVLSSARDWRLIGPWGLYLFYEQTVADRQSYGPPVPYVIDVAFAHNGASSRRKSATARSSISQTSFAPYCI